MKSGANLWDPEKVYGHATEYFTYSADSVVHTEKYFRNLIKSSQNQIVLSIFRMIYVQTDIGLDPNQLGNGKYNLISG